MTEPVEAQPLYFAAISGAAEHAGMPCSIMAVFEDNTKTITGRVIVMERSYNNNLTAVTTKGKSPVWGSARKATGLHRASKAHILARFDNQLMAEQATERAFVNSREDIDKFGDVEDIRALWAEVHLLEARAKSLREEIGAKRKVSWRERFNKTLDILRTGGASYVYEGDPG